MLALIKITTWLELKRLRMRLALLILVLIIFGSLTGINELFTTDIRLNLSFEANVAEMNAPPAELTYQKLMTAIPTLALAALALIAGLIILSTALFRGREEWDSGSLQLFRMSRYNAYQIETARFLVPLIIGVMFFLIVVALSVYTLMKSHALDESTLFRLFFLASYWVIGILPLALTFGCFATALATAYYAAGKSNLLRFLRMLGLFAFANLLMNGVLYLTNPETQLLLSPITIQISNGEHQFFQALLRPEFPLLSLLIAALLLIWSGRIQEEVEL